MQPKKKRLPKSRKNTAQKSGTIVFSIYLFFLIAIFTILYRPFSGTLLHSETPRRYDAQFFAYNLHTTLDYARLKEAGISTLICRVFNDEEVKGGLYFTNSQFTTLAPVLSEIIKGVKEKSGGLELIAWMTARKFKWVDDARLLDYQFEDYRRQTVRKLDIFNPAVIQKLVEVYRELASRKISEILIQDDLTLRYNEGFSNWGKAKFTAVTGAKAIERLMMRKDTPYNKNWKRVKRQQVNKVLKFIIDSCKRVNSGIKVGMNIYYETPVFPDRSEAWYAHNLKDILATGIDHIYLMTYQRQIKKEMKLSEAKTRQLFKKIVNAAYDMCKDKLIVKLQLRDWDTGERVPLEEIRAYLKLIPRGVKRVCFTPVKVEDYDYLKNLLTNKKF